MIIRWAFFSFIWSICGPYHIIKFKEWNEQRKKEE